MPQYLSDEMMAQALADMDLDKINELRDQEMVRREEEAQRRRDSRLNDPSGTVRYSSDDDIFLVCCRDDEEDDVHSWNAYFLERHESLDDDDFSPEHYPIVGQLP